jgi:4-hydroxy-4-methyl-2-oxoglutarate aldolase
MEDWVKRFSLVAAAAVSDALGSFGALSSEIRAMVPGARVAGPCYTVRCHAGSILTLHKAVLEAPAGSVLLVDSGGELQGALMGELMARDCVRAGLAGAVIDGAIRDVAGIRQLGFPVWARASTPRVATNRRLGQTQVPIACGNTPVFPGDWVVADDDGVVVIPKELVASILAGAEAVETKETGIANRIDQGERIADILGLRQTLQS